MIESSMLLNAVLAFTAIILLYAAIVDLRNFRIPNGVIVVLGLLFFVHTGLSGQWKTIPWNIGLASLIFVLLLPFYSRQAVGGGDLKMLTVAFLWTGVECAFAFSVLLLVFAMLHVVAAKLGWAKSRRDDPDGRLRIPFAPSIASALCSVFLLGCFERSS
jgi:prepilin peptidase CpaA